MDQGTWTRFIFIIFCFGTHAHCLPSSYVAAVYEHRVLLNPEPRVPLSRREALEHMRQNVQVYEQQAESAARQGAQIVVFPEDGLQGFNFTRSSIATYLEVVPDPQEESWNPCEHPARHPNTEVQQWLSCMAQRHSLYVVANMGSVQPCSPGSSPCPADGRWHFNTNVVFRSDGLLVARYYKQNLYFEDAFDSPPNMELATFHTPFAGTFGLITCFDILFRQPTVALLEKGVRQLIFPTAWMNQLPLLDTIQFQRAFSLGANVTLLAANIRNDEMIMSGSGIYSPSSAVYHHALSGDPEQGRLVVATLSALEPLPDPSPAAPEPRREPLPDPSPAAPEPRREPLPDPSPAAPEPRREPLPDPSPAAPEPHREQADINAGSCPVDGCSTPHSFTSFMMHDPFTFVLVPGAGGQLSVCDGSFCCWLQYRRTHTNHTELYALGAFAGLHTVNGHYSLQVCALVKCAGADPILCGQEVVEADTKMDFVLEGAFITKHVYPSVLSSHYTLEQPTHLHTTPQGSVTMAHSNMRAGLITASLYGRMYHLDPH